MQDLNGKQSHMCAFDTYGSKHVRKPGHAQMKREEEYICSISNPSFLRMIDYCPDMIPYVDFLLYLFFYFFFTKCGTPK